MEANKSKWSTFLENSKNLAETLAIIVTGIWVLFLFVLKDVPAYNKTIKLTGDLKIDSINISKKGFCQANLSLDAKNLRPSSITIDTLRIKLWYFPIDSLPKDGFLDIKQYEYHHNPFYSYDHFSNALVTFYPVDGDAHDELQFLVENNNNKGLLCEYTAIGKTAKSLLSKVERVEVTGASWIYKCSPESKGKN